MKYRSIITLIVALLLLVLPACTRSASTASPLTTEPSIEFQVTSENTQADVEKAVSPTTEPTSKPKPTQTPVVEETPTAEAVSPQDTTTGVATAEMQYLTPAAPQATASEPAFNVFSGYGEGVPTFGIRGVVYNETVTIQANDFPSGVTYTVTMGRADANGVGFIEAASLESGEGGTFLVTLDLPESLWYVG
ncbi:MAG: hypothetical protein AAGU05_11385, partial [Anaerolineaceae bacterium]